MQTGKIATILIALGLGSVGAWLALPIYQTHRAIKHIASPDQARRDLGWKRLLPKVGEKDEALAQGQLAMIIGALQEAPEDALLDAGANLRRINQWSWNNIPSSLYLKEIESLANRSDASSRMLAAEDLLSCPLDEQGDQLMRLFDNLLDDPDQQVRMLTLQGALGWIGPDRPEAFDRLRENFSDASIRRMLNLAREWTSQPRSYAPPETNQTLDRSEAKLLAGERNDPAEVGDDVYASALRAERQLAHPDAIDFAREWITDFNDQRKQAGALLAALLGEHAQLLAEAYQQEDMPDVRAIQLLALYALGHQPDSPDSPAPLEFAHRVIHRVDGEFDPDVALCLLASGHIPTLEFLTSQPRGDSKSAIGQRLRLILRFLPTFHMPLADLEELEPRSVADHFDSLEARRLLWRRRVIFDQSTRTFTLAEQSSPKP